MLTVCFIFCLNHLLTTLLLLLFHLTGFSLWWVAILLLRDCASFAWGISVSPQCSSSGSNTSDMYAEWMQGSLQYRWRSPLCGERTQPSTRVRSSVASYESTDTPSYGRCDTWFMKTRFLQWHQWTSPMFHPFQASSLDSTATGEKFCFSIHIDDKMWTWKGSWRNNRRAEFHMCGRWWRRKYSCFRHGWDTGQNTEGWDAFHGRNFLRLSEFVVSALFHSLPCRWRHVSCYICITSTEVQWDIRQVVHVDKWSCAH